MAYVRGASVSAEQERAMLEYRHSMLHEKVMAKVPKPECAPIFVAPVSYARVEYQDIEHCGEPIPNHASSHQDYRSYVRELLYSGSFRSERGA